MNNKRSLQMYNLRTELIKSTLSSLKIDNNPFNQQIIRDKIAHIKDEHLQDFYGRLFGNEHDYLNGMDRVAKVAEQFESEVDESMKLEARRLIDLAREINHKVFQDSEKMSRPFSDLMNVIILEQMIDEKDLAILSTVKPHRNAKVLIGEINTYADGNIQLQAFIDALKYQPSDAIQIDNPIQNLRIKR